MHTPLATPMRTNLAPPSERSIASHVPSTLIAVLTAVSLCRSGGQTFQELYSFTGGADGFTPAAALIEGKDGNFYGTTRYGPRPPTENGSGYGTVFKMTPEGTLTTLIAFNGTNGAFPYGALLQASDGNLYGTTLSGSRDAATVFRITPAGHLTTVARFIGGLDNLAGFSPLGGLTEGPDGKLYGVTQDGGDGNSHGTVFRFSTNGTIENLHFFYGYDGLYPSSGLLLASDGNLYGVTAGGGWCNGNGAIYRVTTNGALTTVASFCQGVGNAVRPQGKLLQAEDGSLYGGAGGGWDTIFRYTLEGTLATFARFDGAVVGGLVQANDGYIYGATYDGGWNFDGGTVFRLDRAHGCTNQAWAPCGNLTALFLFGETASGWHPYDGLLQGKDGNLYGTTAFGGPYGAGNIFRLIMPGPRLDSERIGQNLVLSWRTNFTGYGLQSSPDLMERTWTDCTNTVSTISGQHLVTNAISGSSRFFRLSRSSQP